MSSETGLSSPGRILHILLVPIVVFIVLVIALLLVILRLRSPSGRGFIDMAPTVNVIWSMYESALRGNIDAYINAFVPDSQVAIRETLKSKGEEEFKAYLQNMAAGIMGISVLSNDKVDNSDPLYQQGFESESKIISIPVELVFRGKNMIQVFTLERIGKEWKILNAPNPVITPQPIPYGKNVNE